MGCCPDEPSDVEYPCPGLQRMGCYQGEECLELSLGLPASLRLGLPGLQVLTEQLQEWQEPLPEQPEQGSLSLVRSVPLGQLGLGSPLPAQLGQQPQEPLPQVRPVQPLAPRPLA